MSFLRYPQCDLQRTQDVHPEDLRGARIALEDVAVGSQIE